MTNPAIENLLMLMPDYKMQLANELRQIILSANDDVHETIKYGRVTFTFNNNEIAFICSCPGNEFIELGFFKGILLTDPGHLFYNKGRTKAIRRVKILHSQSIPVVQIKNWVNESIEQFNCKNN